MSNIQSIIEDAFEKRADITPRSVDTHVKDAVMEAIDLLDTGKARVAERKVDLPESAHADATTNRVSGQRCRSGWVREGHRSNWSLAQLRLAEPVFAGFGRRAIRGGE